ncbi:hypothetical protein [uncultured Mailhella sp.]|uniref:hypothetical protein n=1 Tax=uncultured Mailhella sp. TaxID=1981031 RepID=UPI0025EF5285|nr:hypothetical protein [uncultured Mailhella sp.]
MKIIGKLFFLWIIFSACFYFFYMDDAEDAAHKTSLFDALEVEMTVSGENSNAPEQREVMYDKLNDYVKDKYDIDLEESIMDVIEEKGFEYSTNDIKHGNGMGEYVVNVKNDQGKKFSIKFIYVDKSMKNASEAQVVLTEFAGEKISAYPSTNIACFVYGVDTDVCSYMDKIHPFYGRNM